MRAIVVSGMIGIVAIAACHDSTSPEQRRPMTAPITAIEVTEHAAPGDTIHIGFEYFTGGCDTATVAILQSSSTVRFTATAYPTDLFCLQDLGSIHQFRYTVLPYHEAPFDVVFTQPQKPDSVRVVGLE